MTIRYQRGVIRFRSGRVYGFWRSEPGQDGKRKWLHICLGDAKKGISRADWRDLLRPHIDDYYRGLNLGGVNRQATLREFAEKVFLPAHLDTWALNTRAALLPALRLHILDPLGEKQLTAVVKADIISRLASMRNEGYANRTLRLVKWLLHAIYEEAIDNDLVVKNPTRHIRVTGGIQEAETRPLTEAEVHSIYTITEGSTRLCWRVLIGCGLRPGELAALRRNDVGPELRIDEALERGQYKTTKTRRTRFVPLPASLAGELEEWLASTKGTPSDPLFPDPWGRPQSADWMREHLQLPVRELAGIPDLTLRQARTTFGTLIRGDIKDVQDLLGHSTAEMTLKHYRKSIDSRMMAAVEEMDKRLVGKGRKRAKVLHMRRAG